MKRLHWRIAVEEDRVDVVPVGQASVGQVSVGQAIKALGREVPVSVVPVSVVQVSVVQGLEDQKVVGLENKVQKAVVQKAVVQKAVVQKAVVQKRKDLRGKRRAPEDPDLGDLDLRDRKVEGINLGSVHRPVSNVTSVAEGSEALVDAVVREAAVRGTVASI